MEKITKSAIYLGMGVVSALFVLFLIVAVPHMLDDALDRWEKMGAPDDAAEQELRTKFQEHPAYKAMYERFPDAKEELEYYSNQGQIKVGVMNFETNSNLILHMDYTEWRDTITIHAECVTNSEVTSKSADSLFVEDFIKRTDCVDAAPVNTD